MWKSGSSYFLLSSGGQGLSAIILRSIERWVLTKAPASQSDLYSRHSAKALVQSCASERLCCSPAGPAVSKFSLSKNVDAASAARPYFPVRASTPTGNGGWASCETAGLSHDGFAAALVAASSDLKAVTLKWTYV